MIQTLAIATLGFLLFSLLAAIFALGGVEPTYRLLLGCAYLTAFLGVGQYLIWPNQPGALELILGTGALAILSLAAFGYVSWRRTRLR
jgi:hypothetical protein